MCSVLDDESDLRCGTTRTLQLLNIKGTVGILEMDYGIYLSVHTTSRSGE